MMNQSDRETGGVDSLNTLLRPSLRRSACRQILYLFLAFALIDGMIFLICPSYGGDCLYGFFTLIAFPVMLSGPAGTLMPRFAMRQYSDWGSRTLIWVIGGLLLLAIVTLCHVVAIRLFNFHDYGEAWIRQRLLGIEIILAMIYYVGLSIIVCIKASTWTQ
jgi:hypothetical protein